MEILLYLFALLLLSCRADTPPPPQASMPPTAAKIDVQFYQIKIDFDLEKNYYLGEVDCQFKVLQLCDTVYFDLVTALQVSEISATTDLVFFQKDNKLGIVFPKLLPRNSLQKIKIKYGGAPQTITEGSITKGLVVGQHGNGEPIITTLSTPFLSHYWFPCNDRIDDKADSVFVSITIPKKSVKGTELMAVSNGKLEYRINLEKEQKTLFQWQHRYPIAPCYVFFAISNYATLSTDITDNYGNRYPLEFYVFPENLAAAQEQLAPVAKAVQHFSEIFGAYPFATERLGFAQIGLYSGIETQTCPVVESFEQQRFYTLVHELAHAWFGNALTVYSWQDAWLQEGFSTYAEALYDERRLGKKGYQASIARKTYMHGGTLYGEATDNPFEVFSGIVYNKGAFVLHQLRGVVGDAAFFEILKTYVTDFQYKNVSTEDFRAVCERISEKDLNRFFEQWVYRSSYPVYYFSFNQSPKNNDITITVSQKQVPKTGFLFEMPIKLWLDFEYRDSVVTIFNTEQAQIFTIKSDQKLLNVHFDYGDWILKEVEAKKQVLDMSNNSIYGFDVTGSLSGRSVSVVLKSSKKQEAELLLRDKNGKNVFKKLLTVSGTSIFNIELPRSVKEGDYELIVESKFERYFKDWRVLF